MMPEQIAEPLSRERIAELRRLAEAATPGPWRGTTIGTASQRDAAMQAAQAVLARRLSDGPDIEFSDLSWVRTEGDDSLNVAVVGNGPTSPENAAYIAAVSPDVVLALLAAIPAKPDDGERLRKQLVAAAVEWEEAHDELTVGAGSEAGDEALLERYFEACVELLAVVSQNRAALTEQEARDA